MPDPIRHDPWHGPPSDSAGIFDGAGATGGSGPAHGLPHDDESSPILKTGTTTVAMAADDAVVMTADRRASVGGGRVVANKSTRKVEAVHPTAALAAAGAVGSIQAFARTLRAEVRLHEGRRGDAPDLPALATLAGNLLRSGRFVGVGATLGGVGRAGPRVYDLDGGGAVLESEYVAGGSGMPYALGVLESDYETGLSREEAVALAARAVESASERDTASGNGLAVAEVTAEGVEIREFDDAREVAA